MEKATLLLLALAALASCKHPVQSDEMHTIAFDRHPEKTIGSIIDSVSYLPLETTDKSAFADINKMIIKDSLIYIADYKQSRVAAFDFGGRAALTLNRQGRGEGEYQNILGFTVDNNHNIYVMDGGAAALLKYDRNGKFLSRQKLPIMAWDMSIFDNGNLMFATAKFDQQGFSTGQSSDHIFITNQNSDILSAMFPYEKKDPIGKNNGYLFEDDENIIFHNVGSDIVTRFPKNNSAEIENFFVDFGPSKIPEKHRPSYEEILNGGYNYIHETPRITGRYWAFDISGDTFIYDSAAHQWFGQNDNDAIFMLFPQGCFDGKFYAAIDGVEMYEAWVEDGFPPAPPAVVEHLQGAGSVLIVYHMKK